MFEAQFLAPTASERCCISSSRVFYERRGFPVDSMHPDLFPHAHFFTGFKDDRVIVSDEVPRGLRGILARGELFFHTKQALFPSPTRLDALLYEIRQLRPGDLDSFLHVRGVFLNQLLAYSQGLESTYWLPGYRPDVLEKTVNALGL